LAKKKLGEQLLDSRLIQAPQLEEALRLQIKTNELLGKILQKMGFVSEEEVARALAEQMAMPFVTEAELEACRDFVCALPLDLRLRRKIFPLDSENGRLRLAMANPFDWRTVDEAAFTTGLKIVPVLASESAIMNVLERQAGPSAGLRDFLHGPEATAKPEDAPGPRNVPAPSEAPAALLAEALAKIREGLAVIEDVIARYPPPGTR
jgi:hypothetical protein